MAAGRRPDEGLSVAETQAMGKATPKSVDSWETVDYGHPIEIVWEI